jgi:TRAP-type mannitol/chloroaromatic compound transport system permease small subunit
MHLFGRRAESVLRVLGYLLGACLFLLFLKGGIDPALRSFANGEFDGEGALRVPVWPTRFMILLGSALAAFNYLVLAIVEGLGLEAEEPVL